MDIINIGAADLQGPKKSSETAKKKPERCSERDCSRSVSDRLSLSAASLEMEQKLKALSEELSRMDPIRWEMVEEVKERLSRGELETDETVREAVESLLDFLNRDSDMTY